jgi:hypothetical protein
MEEVIRQMFARCVASFAVVVAFFNLSAFGLPAAKVTLAWDPSADSTVVGYRLYHGTQSAVYTNMTDIRNITSTTISNLVQGGTYYFAVTAYDAAGLESAFSGEISYTVPISANAPLLNSVSIPSALGSPALLSGMGNVGDVYTVLGTQDFVSWNILGTTIVGLDGTFQFSDPSVTGVPARFYRLQRLELGL